MQDPRVAALSRGHDLALFAAGCFWHPESRFRALDGVVATAVGYSDGHMPSPDYDSVCQGHSGHAEVFLVEFDPKRLTYSSLVEFLFSFHDGGYGGPGAQYRSAVFTYDEAQSAVAAAIVKAQRENGKALHTTVTPASEFWPAEERHQRYYEKHGMAAAVDKPSLASSDH